MAPAFDDTIHRLMETLSGNAALIFAQHSHSSCNPDYLWMALYVRQFMSGLLVSTNCFRNLPQAGLARFCIYSVLQSCFALKKRLRCILSW